jgi:uncharacterized PurR-regulated membrane protein YhhQ (DUF165 family)
VQLPEGRDRKAVAIGVALALFVLVVLVGSALLWLADSALDWSDRTSEVLRIALLAIAGASVVVYLSRARRP